MTTQTDETMTKHGTTVEYEVVECRGCTDEKPKDDCVKFVTYEKNVSNVSARTMVKNEHCYTKGWLCSNCRDRPRVYEDPRLSMDAVSAMMLIALAVGIAIGVCAGMYLL